MKITVLFTGKTSMNYLKEGITEYAKRLRRYVPFEIHELTQWKRQKDGQTQKQLEGKAILKAVDTETFVILLDERGERVTSVSFANLLEKKMNEGVKKIAVVTGGAFGVSEDVFQRANLIIRLSSMTFSHQVVRILLMEQLYRAFTIIRGQPYHHA